MIESHRPQFFSSPDNATGSGQESSPELVPMLQQYDAWLRASGLEQQAETYQLTLQVARAVQAAGGRALLVGGSVRDMLVGVPAKDFDVEVYGVSAELVAELAGQLGKVSDVGKAFGILKLSANGYDVDISLPRTDSKIGVGHRGFAVKTDANMSVADAARRRDFTINAMAADPLTGELFDPWNGRDDLRRRLLRVTDAERFQDDPLRVLRGLQFVGRFGLSIDPASAELMRQMVPQLAELPKERIGEEWKKLLLKSEKPSLGLAAGMALGVFHQLHPEFPPLAKTPQDPEWHPEGDVWVHSLKGVDAAADIVRREEVEQESALVVMLGTLCHDLGKATTTEFSNGRWRSHGHEPAGEEPTKKFLAQIGIEGSIRDKVARIVVNHLVPTMFYTDAVVKKRPVTDGAIRRLAKRIAPATIYELTLVAQADHYGRGPFPDPNFPAQLLLPEGRYPAGAWLRQRAEELGVERTQPVDLIKGRELLALGFLPGVAIGNIIRLANDLRDNHQWTREMVLQTLVHIADPAVAIATLEKQLTIPPDLPVLSSEDGID